MPPPEASLSLELLPQVASWGRLFQLRGPEPLVIQPLSPISRPLALSEQSSPEMKERPVPSWLKALTSTPWVTHPWYLDLSCLSRKHTTAPLGARGRVQEGVRGYGRVGMANRSPPSLLIICCRSPAPCVSLCGEPICSSHRVQGRAGDEASNLLARECGLTTPAHCSVGPRRSLGQPAPSPVLEKTLPGLVSGSFFHPVTSGSGS